MSCETTLSAAYAPPLVVLTRWDGIKSASPARMIYLPYNEVEDAMIIKRLSEVMDGKGVTVSALARGACISRGAAHKLYHGQNGGIALDVLDKVCGFLEVQVGDILVYAPEGSGAQRIEEAREHERSEQQLLLDTLQALLAVEATELKSALDQASGMVREAVGAETVDVFLHDPATESLVIAGASHTPLGRRETEIGMDRLPITNGGRPVEVYESGDPYVTGCAERDPMVPAGFTDGLGVRSLAAVPLDVASRRRGLLQALSTEPDAFTQEELDFLMGVARWVGLLVHRAELVDLLTREAVREARRTGVDELVTALAHDLGDHLSPLRTRVDSLERRARQERRKADLEDVAIASVELGRLRGLLADLLELGRLGRETSALRQQHVDLAALTRETAQTFHSVESKVRVHAPEETVVEADPDRLQQAIRDLLSAAISVSPDGIPVVVEVGTRTGHDGRWADLCVRDETPGAVASERESPGSNAGGLGLYVARAVAESHGGTLSVESLPREGTTFCLRLPVGESE